MRKPHKCMSIRGARSGILHRIDIEKVEFPCRVPAPLTNNADDQHRSGKAGAASTTAPHSGAAHHWPRASTPKLGSCPFVRLHTPSVSKRTWRGKFPMLYLACASSYKLLSKYCIGSMRILVAPRTRKYRYATSIGTGESRSLQKPSCSLAKP